MFLLFQGRSWWWLRVALLLNFLTFSTATLAISIFEVRKRLPLRNGEEAQRDFYLNGGSELGLKEGMILQVTRRATFQDNYDNKTSIDFVIPVGELKIIFTQKGVSVGRLHQIFDRRNLPVLEDNFLMVGDGVDVSSARMDKTSKLDRKSGQMGSGQMKSQASKSVVKLKPPASKSMTNRSISSKAPSAAISSSLRARVLREEGESSRAASYSP